MIEVQCRGAKRADRIVFKAVPAQSVPMVWTPHGGIPLRARGEPETGQCGLAPDYGEHQ